MNSIQQSMSTLPDYNEQLKSQLLIHMTQTEMSQNLSKHSFSKVKYKLLNRNLNYVPEPHLYD